MTAASPQLVIPPIGAVIYPPGRPPEALLTEFVARVVICAITELTLSTTMVM